MEIEKGSDLKSKFLHTIANDSPITKLWKFRVFIQLHPEVALDLKDKMLDFALKNRLVGEYEAIFALFGVTLINIPRVGVYDQIKTEMQTIVNKMKIEAAQFEQVVINL